MEKKGYFEKSQKNKKIYQENEFVDDIVFARFINYMKIALSHRKMNYLKHQSILERKEQALNSEEWVILPVTDNLTHSFCAFERIEINSDKAILKKHLSKLTKKQQKVLYLSYVEKITNKNIALKMNVSEKAIEHLKERALKKLREYMEGL